VARYRAARCEQRGLRDVVTHAQPPGLAESGPGDMVAAFLLVAGILAEPTAVPAST